MSLNKNSKHYDDYYNHVLYNKKSIGTMGKIFDIIDNISDRRGLSQEWENIDGDIQDEIIYNWINIIEK